MSSEPTWLEKAKERPKRSPWPEGLKKGKVTSFSFAAKKVERPEEGEIRLDIDSGELVKLKFHYWQTPIDSLPSNNNDGFLAWVVIVLRTGEKRGGFADNTLSAHVYNEMEALVWLASQGD